MAASNEYLQYILEQLSGLARVTSLRMFGGFGLYCDGLFFGLIFTDTLYFKVDDKNRGDYESRGMARFKPYADKPHLSMSYYEVPVDVLEDSEQLVAWARRSVDASLSSAKETPIPKKRAGVRKAKSKKKRKG
jgi:DNA transformation protein